MSLDNTIRNSTTFTDAKQFLSLQDSVNNLFLSYENLQALGVSNEIMSIRQDIRYHTKS